MKKLKPKKTFLMVRTKNGITDFLEASEVTWKYYYVSIAGKPYRFNRKTMQSAWYNRNEDVELLIVKKVY